MQRNRNGMLAPAWRCGVAMFFLAGIVVADPLQPGATRAQVVAALGEPTGAIVTDTREVLSYPEGKVIVDQGRFVSATFDLDAALKERPPSETGEQPPSLPSNVRKAQGTISVTRGKELAWLSDLDEAKAKAESQHKRLLVLFTGEPAEPWNPIFTREVVYNPALQQQLQQDFVLVKLTCPSPSAVEAGDADTSRAKALETFRQRTIGGSSYPALAIVTADGRRAAAVDLDDAAHAQGRMAAYVKEAIEAAKEKPLRSRGGVSGGFVLAAIGGLLMLIWLLKH